MYLKLTGESFCFRLPRIPISDTDSDFISPRDMPLSPEEHITLVEQRTQQMTSALSSVRMNEHETDISRQLDRIDTAREEKDIREKAELERQLRKPDQLTVEDGQFTYRNEYFRDLSERDHRDKIDTDFILDRMVEANNDEVFKVDTQPQKRKGEHLVGRHAMDKNQETAVGAGIALHKYNCVIFVRILYMYFFGYNVASLNLNITKPKFVKKWISKLVPESTYCIAVFLVQV